MKTALLIIDIQNDYFPEGKMELDGSLEASAATARLLSAFRKQSWPIFHVQHINIRPGATFFLPGTDGADIHTSVTPLPDEPVIVKHYPSSFRNTNLLEQLRSAGIGALLICGMMSHMCIDTTVRAAFDLGFTCIVAHDACATRSLTFDGLTVSAEQVHASYMAALGAVFAQVTSADAILDNMQA